MLRRNRTLVVSVVTTLGARDRRRSRDVRDRRSRAHHAAAVPRARLGSRCCTRRTPSQRAAPSDIAGRTRDSACSRNRSRPVSTHRQLRTLRASISRAVATPSQFSCEVVAGDYFATLGARPCAVVSSRATRIESPSASPVVIIGHDLWLRRYGGDAGIVGQTVRVNGTELTVIGIMPPGFTGLTGRAELWFPAVQAPRLTYPEYLTTNQDFISVVARLQPGRVHRHVARGDRARSARRSSARCRATSEVPGDRFGATALPLTRGSRQRHDAARDARAARRRRRRVAARVREREQPADHACRVPTPRDGCPPRARRLTRPTRRQLLTESLVLSALGGAVGLAMAWWATQRRSSRRPAAIAPATSTAASANSCGRASTRCCSRSPLA